MARRKARGGGRGAVGAQNRRRHALASEAGGPTRAQPNHQRSIVAAQQPPIAPSAPTHVPSRQVEVRAEGDSGYISSLSIVIVACVVIFLVAAVILLEPELRAHQQRAVDAARGGALPPLHYDDAGALRGLPPGEQLAAAGTPPLPIPTFVISPPEAVGARVRTMAALALGGTLARWARCVAPPAPATALADLSSSSSTRKDDSGGVGGGGGGAGGIGGSDSGATSRIRAVDPPSLDYVLQESAAQSSISGATASPSRGLIVLSDTAVTHRLWRRFLDAIVGQSPPSAIVVLGGTRVTQRSPSLAPPRDPRRTSLIPLSTDAPIGDVLGLWIGPDAIPPLRAAIANVLRAARVANRNAATAAATDTSAAHVSHPTMRDILHSTASPSVLLLESYPPMVLPPAQKESLSRRGAAFVENYVFAAEALGVTAAQLRDVESMLRSAGGASVGSVPSALTAAPAAATSIASPPRSLAVQRLLAPHQHPFVVVVIARDDDAPWIEGCLASILSQRAYFNYRVIVAHNGCSNARASGEDVEGRISAALARLLSAPSARSRVEVLRSVMPSSAGTIATRAAKPLAELLACDVLPRCDRWETVVLVRGCDELLPSCLATLHTTLVETSALMLYGNALQKSHGAAASHVASRWPSLTGLVARSALRAEPWGFVQPHAYNAGVARSLAPSLLQRADGSWLDGEPAERALFYAVAECVGGNAFRVPTPLYLLNRDADALRGAEAAAPLSSRTSPTVAAAARHTDLEYVCARTACPPSEMYVSPSFGVLQHVRLV